VHWKKVTLVGVGLLGGSLGLALKERRLADLVAGYVRRAASVRECEETGAVDLATLDLRRAVADADLVVLCTPIAQMRSLMARLAPMLRPEAVITDVGSVKKSVVEELTPIVAKARAHFIGSHPMAGSEKTGVAAARADLFMEAVCVITPEQKSNRAAVRKVTSLWKSVGCRVLRLTPEAHDQFVSRSSHLPHVVAAQLATLVLSPGNPRAQALLCANGFRDTTRIASGSPEMWRDIAMANQKNLVGALDSFVSGLAGFKQALKRGDEAAVSRFFKEAKVRRDKWSNGAGSCSPE
jgi:prephenate dehydrogenase